jgi:hypothetical protein
MEVDRKSTNNITANIYLISHLTHMGWRKDEKWYTGNFSSEETPSGMVGR